MKNPLTPAEVSLVKESYHSIRPLSETFSMLFYLRLFEIAPHLETLFTSGIEAQGKKLMDTLETIVDGLEDFSGLRQELVMLGKRHIDYGVEDAHYDILWEALIWSLDRALNEEFSPEMAAAWNVVYQAIADVMKDKSA